MPKTKNDILQGTLALIVLKTLAAQGRMHGYAITAHIQRVSDDLLRVEEGSLYPALHRMAQDGWLRAEWGTTEKNRQARFYTITAAGKKQLELEEESWARLRQAPTGSGARELAATHGRRGPRPALRLSASASWRAAMSWFARIRNVVRPDRLSDDLDREMSFHLAERTDELIAEGMPRDAARRCLPGSGSTRRWCPWSWQGRRW